MTFSKDKILILKSQIIIGVCRSQKMNLNSMHHTYN